MPTITIGCRLPCGIRLEHEGVEVLLNGQNSGKSGIILLSQDDYGTTQVDESFWDAWKANHSEFPALKSGAIFEAKSASEAKGKAKELKGEKTGHEPLSQTAGGVKSADE